VTIFNVVQHGSAESEYLTSCESLSIKPCHSVRPVGIQSSSMGGFIKLTSCDGDEKEFTVGTYMKSEGSLEVTNIP
jgi:hypothetical protein